VPGRDAARAELEQYSGVDIVVYRVPQPLAFLKGQHNLHRIEVAGNYRGEGLANTLRYLWDSWWKQSRLAWRKMFEPDARRAVTGTHPALATSDAIHRRTVFANDPQYRPLKGFDQVDRFRYPLWAAQPIQPPKGVKLDGSSSEFIGPAEGNVMIPIGKRKPGLYLVEAMIGEHRATTLVFVSDTMAVTKVSSGQMFVWTARRDTGGAVPGAHITWTDGTGVLQSATTDASGIASLERTSPEHTYVVAEDRDGGVCISEQYYYDSEIYNTKLFAFTDRPLYRPGDEVNVKFLAREFLSARQSRQAAPGPVNLTVYDPNGTPLLSQALLLAPDTGAETRFRLPETATAGGYELRFAYKGDTYGAAFRVAEYVKPHFEIDIRPSRPEFKTGEAVTGVIALRYPDGKPVRNARVALTLRGQKNVMVDGELRYTGLFPVALKSEELTSDADGNAAFTLPAAADPSRYILTALATDGAAYRVKLTRELLIERSASTYLLRSARQFSDPGQRVHFDLVPVGQASARPVKWEMIRLETQARTTGAFDPAARGWDVAFPGTGSYQLTLRDERGNLLAAASHWVSGAGVQAPPGSIEIVLDRARYAPGDTAEALVTFAQPVDQALVTLERDKVEQAGLVGRTGSWFKARRIAPRQWRVQIPVREEYGPNMTFSVAYTRNGDFVFENAGIEVIEPRIALQFKADKEVYQPGDKVTLDVTAQLDGRPVSTLVTLGVVDEMIYVLQPEIAPDIGDFFYHPRRNNVRTTASTSFIGYDMAQPLGGEAPARHNYHERGVKVLERPRRDDVDTALWAPTLKTDANGHLRVTFTMPDALTRWRVTARAMDAEGRVGQRTAYVRSDKPYYAKWTGPDWMRRGDAPRAAIAVFNQTGKEQALQLSLGGTQKGTVSLSARPGINYAEFPLTATPGPLRIEVRQAGVLVDALDTTLRTLPAEARTPRSLVVPLSGTDAALKLPADARNVRVTFASDASSHFARIADDLVAYPYGGVEQTASRMIPLAMAIRGLPGGAGDVRARLTAVLQSQRLRLVAMAGPNAVFGWWGDGTEGDPLLTAYAYYADWLAARTLGLELPAEHWNNLLSVYQQSGLKAPLPDRALVLWLANEMGLPTKTLVEGLVADSTGFNPAPAPVPASPRASLVLGADRNRMADAVGLGLLAIVAQRNGVELPPPLAQQADAAWSALEASQEPLGRALLLLANKTPAAKADAILGAVRSDYPTIDRALTLAWTQAALGGGMTPRNVDLALATPWRRVANQFGQDTWFWPEAQAPARLVLGRAAPAGAVAIVGYDSAAAEDRTLPVGVTRRLQRLVPGKDGFRAEPVEAGGTLRTDELYLDEITLTPAQGMRARFGVVEVPLPPGAAVETGTWGVRLLGGGDPQPLERARAVDRRDGYAVPIDTLAAPVTVRHLLRFSQKGAFTLPSARFYRMYQPDQKAFEGGAPKTLRVQ